MTKETMMMASDEDGNCDGVNCHNNEVMRIVLILVLIMK